MVYLSSVMDHLQLLGGLRTPTSRFTKGSTPQAALQYAITSDTDQSIETESALQLLEELVFRSEFCRIEKWRALDFYAVSKRHATLDFTILDFRNKRWEGAQIITIELAIASFSRVCNTSYGPLLDRRENDGTRPWSGQEVL